MKYPDKNFSDDQTKLECVGGYLIHTDGSIHYFEDQVTFMIEGHDIYCVVFYKDSINVEFSLSTNNKIKHIILPQLVKFIGLFGCTGINPFSTPMGLKELICDYKFFDKYYLNTYMGDPYSYNITVASSQKIYYRDITDYFATRLDDTEYALFLLNLKKKETKIK
jgi:hypothetical protein